MKKIDISNQPKIDSGFKIPDDYFEEFEERLMNRLNENVPIDNTEVITLKRATSFWFTRIAALLILSLGIGYYIYQNNSTIDTQRYQYLANDTELSYEEIVPHLNDDDLKQLENEILIIDTESETYVKNYLN